MDKRQIALLLVTVAVVGLVGGYLGGRLGTKAGRGTYLVPPAQRTTRVQPQSSDPYDQLCEEATGVFRAAATGDRAGVGRFLDKGVSVDGRDSTGLAPLHFAAIAGQTGVAELLIERGADVNADAGRDSSSCTPLRLAAMRRHPGMVRLLLSHEADPNVVSKDGSPLHWAAGLGEEEIMRLLIEYGPDVNAKGLGDRTPLYRAMDHRNEPILVEILLEAGANVNAKAYQGETPLTFAAQKGRDQCIEVLLKYGPDLDAKDDRGRTALDWALFEGHAGIADLLRAHGAHE